MFIVPRTRRAGAVPLVALLIVALAACDQKPAPVPDDPNRPAVVKVPRPTLPIEVASADTSRPPVVDLVQAKITLATHYAVLGIAISGNDLRMINAIYAFDAELITADSTYRGGPRIASALGAAGPARSLRDFRRQSLVTKIADSTVTDSGTYVMVSKRTGADSLFERGRYASSWRIRPRGLDWVMTQDRLYRDEARPRK